MILECPTFCFCLSFFRYFYTQFLLEFLPEYVVSFLFVFFSSFFFFGGGGGEREGDAHMQCTPPTQPPNNKMRCSHMTDQEQFKLMYVKIDLRRIMVCVVVANCGLIQRISRLIWTERFGLHIVFINPQDNAYYLGVSRVHNYDQWRNERRLLRASLMNKYQLY